MNFDPVHDTQAAYRILLDCMARPGVVGNLAPLRDRIGLDAPLDKGFLLLGMTLLDGETSFSVPRQGALERAAEAEAEAEAFLARIFSCPIEDPERAAFLFLPCAPAFCSDGPNARIPEQIRKAVEGATRGTLQEPHLGATVIVGIENLGTVGSGGQETGVRWILEGPGIQDRAELSCGPRDSALVKEVLRARGKACSEFPLGVDLIILDAAARIACIPRTTMVREA